MTICCFSRHDYGHKCVNYVIAVARLVSLPAQGFAKRSIEACVEWSNTTVSNSEIDKWLFNAAASGSLIAAEDLAKISSARM